MRVLTRFAATALTLGLPAAAAHASATTSYEDVGFGRLAGYNPFNTLDDARAGLSVRLTRSPQGLVTTDVVAATLGGASFTVTEHGSQTGSSNSYLAGFTFNLDVPSYLRYAPSSAGETWTWRKGIPSLSGGTVSPGIQLATTDATSFAMMPAGKYTLLFSGAVNLAMGASTAFGGVISAVPVPGALIMFGSAVLGFAAFGCACRPAPFARRAIVTRA